MADHGSETASFQVLNAEAMAEKFAALPETAAESFHEVMNKIAEIAMNNSDERGMFILLLIESIVQMFHKLFLIMQDLQT